MTAPVGQWSGCHFPVQGAQVPSLVRELRSHKPPGQKKIKRKKRKRNQKRYCNKFNKDFQDGPHKKKKSLPKNEK